MSAFNVGDVVQLRSGGPEMTVLAVLHSGEVTCAWFTPDDAIQSEKIPIAALMTVELANP
ncbi:hypothetical protein GCM10010096_00040 [Alcaligenes pakistanensis]|uniref:DUF2158 domain-containing protein n=1 Tax=Alcaligenes pakistanensis TaxID=1482717 RepID=A0A8H9IHS7_9BURK|nr:hypothetical protein GCM10010096_00040 [Alcaligenes pakistanensis]HCA18699.1 DUF2158 domain-containing protein [Alcaligenes faecalis]